jgi:hypothetical protein
MHLFVSLVSFSGVCATLCNKSKCVVGSSSIWFVLFWRARATKTFAIDHRWFHNVFSDDKWLIWVNSIASLTLAISVSVSFPIQLYTAVVLKQSAQKQLNCWEATFQLVPH